jgi:predicted nucleic acid-binding protein
MRVTWVVNASPLISLAKIGRLDLLSAAEREVLIPAAVAEEILAGPAGDPASVALAARSLGEPVPTASRVEVVEWGLGAGETAVLSLALETGATAVIDDREARAAARSLGVRVIGTLGVVILARQEGRIPAAASVIAELRRAGLRLDEALLRQALRQFVGEDWGQ